MQGELHVLQPQLVKTSEATERLMVKIEQDTVIVEAKKEVNITQFGISKPKKYTVNFYE